MLPFILPFAAYVLVPLISELLKVDPTADQLAKLLIVGLLLFYYRKHYKLTRSINLISIAAGIIIFILWVGLEGLYPFFLGQPKVVQTDAYYVLLRLANGIIIAPVIEEFFTRYFLNRVLQSNDWEKIPINKFTLASFTITVLFFGLSHGRWLPGILTAIILNLLLMKTKSIEQCVYAHAIANFALAIFVFSTQNWVLWG